MNVAAIPKTVAMARIGFAANAFLAPKLATPFLGVRAKDMTAAGVVWARLFASREAALGAFTLGSEGAAAECRRKVLLLNAAVDAVDVVAAVLVCRRYRTIGPLLVAAPVAALSAIGHYQAAQQLQAG